MEVPEVPEEGVQVRRVVKPSHVLRYVGSVAIADKRSASRRFILHRPVILSMDWCACPKGFGLNQCQDMVVCTGPRGTYIYLRQIKEEEKKEAKEKKNVILINDLHYGWKQMFFYPHIKGNLCKWSPDIKRGGSGEEPGHMVIATLSDTNNPACVVLLKYQAPNQKFDIKTIYKADFDAPGCRDAITDVFWSLNSCQILVFQKNTHRIHSLRWSRVPGSLYFKWDHQDLYPDGDDAVHDWFGCPQPAESRFATTHSNTHLRFYELTHGSDGHWEPMPVKEDKRAAIGTRSMCFDKDGDWLSTLMLDNRVMVWRCYLNPIIQPYVLQLILGCIIAQDDVPRVHLTWLRHRVLVLSGDDLDSVVVYTMSALPKEKMQEKLEEKAKEKPEDIYYNDLDFVRDRQCVIWKRKTEQKIDMKGVAPFNAVKGISGHPGKNDVLCVNGHNGFLHMYRNGGSRFITRVRDFVAEKRFLVPSRHYTKQQEACEAVVQRMGAALKEMKQSFKEAKRVLTIVQGQDKDNHKRLKRVDAHCVQVLNKSYGGEQADYTSVVQDISKICKFEVSKNTQWKDKVWESSSDSDQKVEGQDEDEEDDQEGGEDEEGDQDGGEDEENDQDGGEDEENDQDGGEDEEDED